MAEKIIRTEYSEVMQKSYIDYSMSVITARALPDVRDGLKPVQRRTLYDMYELGIQYDKPFRKCARIVGDTMGKYHPHGDSSIYDALVVMAQDFKKGQPLVDGHGNFGSIEGDGAAAMRYTEARLQKITQEVYLKDLDKDVVGIAVLVLLVCGDERLRDLLDHVALRDPAFFFQLRKRRKNFGIHVFEIPPFKTRRKAAPARPRFSGMYVWPLRPRSSPRRLRSR